MLGPAAVFLGLQRLRSAEHDDILTRAERAALPWRGSFAAALGSSPLSAAIREEVQRSLEKLRTEDPLLHRAALWRFVDRQVKAIDLTTGADRPLRAMRPEEQEGESHGRPHAALFGVEKRSPAGAVQPAVRVDPRAGQRSRTSYPGRGAGADVRRPFHDRLHPGRPDCGRPPDVEMARQTDLPN